MHHGVGQCWRLEEDVDNNALIVRSLRHVRQGQTRASAATGLSYGDDRMMALFAWYDSA
jgi:hypothetical protein